MNEVSLEKIINLVVKEVINELNKNGVQITNNPINSFPLNKNEKFLSGLKTKVERIDMSRYKTPILTERHLEKLHELTGEIIIPSNTVITPKAREIIKRKNISITYE